MLYIVATPIGNLKDITLRALEVLKECDLILCEDTRRSRPLLNHFAIATPLKSFHKFSEHQQEDAILNQLQQGQKIALISDAGTPLISDPGSSLVQKCIKLNIPLTSIPGVCSPIAALISSGLTALPFQFVGFLPKKEKQLQITLIKLLEYPGTTLCFESPNRLKATLAALAKLVPKRPLAVARELTKKFEEIVRGEANELLNHWKDKTPKGEIILLISGRTEQGEAWQTFSLQEHVSWLEKTFKISKKEAIKLTAELRGLPKRKLYQEFVIPKLRTGCPGDIYK